MLRANQSIEEFGPIFQALGLTDTTDPDLMVEHMRARADDTPEAARQRIALKEALELKDYEFNAHGVELGQRYASTAVVPDGSPDPATRATTSSTTTRRPGRARACRTAGSARAATRSPPTTSSARAASALLTGISGGAWASAAQRVAATLNIDLVAHVIGPGREYTDLYDDWARVREVGEDGCVLVRPDAHVAWRANTLVDDPEAALTEVLQTMLDRAPVLA